MKRGLKVAYMKNLKAEEKGYNHCPDEKGTERTQMSDNRQQGAVTTIAPMKRGLKENRI